MKMKDFGVISYRGCIYYTQLQKVTEKSTFNIKIKMSKINLEQKIRNNYDIGYISANIAQISAPLVKFLTTNSTLFAVVSEVFSRDSENIESIRVYKVHVKGIALEWSCELSKKLKTSHELSANESILLDKLFSLIRGPKIIFISNNCLFVMYGKGTAIKLKKCISLKETVSKMWLLPVEVCSTTDEKKIVVIVTGNKFHSYLLRLSSQKLEITDIRNGIFSLPNIFAAVTNDVFPDCCTMKCSCSKNSSPYSTFPHTTDKFSLLAVTSKSQIVKFEDGHLLECHPIPFSDSCKVFTMMNSLGATYYIVVSMSENICLLDHSFKVVQEIDGISHCSVDDFVCSGAQQLLAFPNPLWAEDEQFILTDLSVHHIDKTSKNEQKEGTDEKENLPLVTKALQSKLQMCLAELQAKKQVYQNKQELVQRSCAAIEDITAGKQPSNTKTPSHLVSLTGASAVKDSPQYNNREETDDCHIQVSDEIWQRVVEQQWVIGVTVFNTSKSPIRDLHMFITPVRGTSHQQLTPLSVSSKSTFSLVPVEQKNDEIIFSQPAFKKSRLISHSDSKPISDVQRNSLAPGKSAQLVCCTELPQFDTVESKRCIITVGWSKVEDIEEDTDMSSIGDTCEKSDALLSNEKHYKAKVIGEVMISAQDVISRTYSCFSEVAKEKTRISEIDKRRDLISLDLCQISSTVNMKSTYSLCSSLLAVLQKSLNASYISQFDQYVMLQTGPLTGVRVKVLHMGKDTATVCLYARDASQLLLLIHSLYQHLPDDIIFSPAVKRCSDQSVSSLQSAMNKEMTIIRSSVKETLAKTKEETPARSSFIAGKFTSVEKMDTESVENSRKEFKMMQENVSDRKGSHISVEKMKKLMDIKLGLELETDTLVQNLL